MAILHYRVVPFGQHWLVSCEDVAIQDFDSEKGALTAVSALIKAARQRGDHTTLVVRQPYQREQASAA